MSPEDRRAWAAISPAGLARAVTEGRSAAWEPFRHLLFLDRYLVDWIEGRIRRLIVHIPIRHGKSDICSLYTPAFCLANFQDDGFLHAMHTAEIVGDYGGAARELLETHGRTLYDPPVVVDRRSARKTNWKIAGRNGRYIGRGVRGSFPSRGGRRFMLDDPTKSPAEAMSVGAQAALFSWYQRIARGRLTGDGSFGFIMARWQPNDLVGKLMNLWENAGLDYTYLRIPAISEGAGDPLGRPKGEALEPRMYTAEQLSDLRKEVGEEAWFAQFQGDPLPERGDFFSREWIKRFEIRAVLGVPSVIALGDRERGEVDRVIPIKRLRIMQYVDLATAMPKPGTDPDYFVVMTVGIDLERKEVYILHVFRDRIPGPDQIPQLMVLYKTFRPWRVKIESTGYQLSTVQAAIRAGLPAEEIKRPRNLDKMARANYAAQRMKVGAILCPTRSEWNADFEAELVAFPRGHDDQIDTLADAANDTLNLDASSDALAVGSRQ